MPRSDRSSVPSSLDPDKPKRRLTHIVIPIEIWEHPTLSSSAKFLAAEIMSLNDPERGCFASNAYLANFMRLSEVRIQALLLELKKADLIEHVSFDGRSRVLRPKSQGVCHLENKVSATLKTIPIYTTSLQEVEIDLETSNHRSPVEMKLSQNLLDQILSRKPNFKLPNMAVWAREMEKLMRIDRRTEQEVSSVIAWSQADSFWQNNILSPDKLRKHFDKLELKMRQTSAPQRARRAIPRVIAEDGKYAGIGRNV